MERGPGTLAYRWRSQVRRFLGAEILARDEEGCARCIVEAGWLAVGYRKGKSHEAFVDSVERARANRTTAIVKMGSGWSTVVTGVSLETVVGVFDWRSDLGTRAFFDEGPGYESGLHSAVVRGTLVLPDGRSIRSSAGSGLFDLPGFVHAHLPWRDVDVAQRWDLITEIGPDVPEAWRPVAIAFPLLLFTEPPRA